YKYSHASRARPNIRKAQKRNSQSRINSCASLPISRGAGGLTSLASVWSSILLALQQTVEVTETAKHESWHQTEQHKPAPGRPRGFPVKRVGRFEHSVAHGFDEANV